MLDYQLLLDPHIRASKGAPTTPRAALVPVAARSPHATVRRICSITWCNALPNCNKQEEIKTNEKEKRKMNSGKERT